MQNDKNVKWRNPRRYSGLFRILRFEIFFTFYSFSHAAKIQNQAQIRARFFMKDFLYIFLGFGAKQGCLCYPISWRKC